jgi:Zinc finger, C3HC4 type (RING finger)
MGQPEYDGLPTQDLAELLHKARGPVAEGEDCASLKDMNDKLLARTLCSVCKEEYRQVVVAKCGHMFCKGCVEQRFNSRNRKCPSCNTAFGRDDIIETFC